MKKIWILFLSIVVMAGCIQPITNFPQIPNMGFESTQDVMAWVSVNIRWVDDDIHYPKDEYWQSPLQTYTWRAGDCEDYSILAMYLIYSHLGMKADLATGWLYGSAHAWVSVDGMWWEPQWGVPVFPDNGYKLYQYISYDDAIRRSTTTHRIEEGGEDE